jgi:hypothetical protein
MVNTTFRMLPSPAFLMVCIRAYDLEEIANWHALLRLVAGSYRNSKRNSKRNSTAWEGELL